MLRYPANLNRSLNGMFSNHGSPNKVMTLNEVTRHNCVNVFDLAVTSDTQHMLSTTKSVLFFHNVSPSKHFELLFLVIFLVDLVELTLQHSKRFIHLLDLSFIFPSSLFLSLVFGSLKFPLS